MKTSTRNEYLRMTLVAGAIISMGIGTAATAQTTTPSKNTLTAMSPEQRLEKADTDGNGSISIEEAVAMGASEMGINKSDADSNGELNLDEFTALLEYEPDSGIDGTPSDATSTRKTTLTAMSSEDRMAKVDTNGDGSVSAEEAMAMGASKEGIEQADSDGDGSLTMAEFDALLEFDPMGSVDGTPADPVQTPRNSTGGGTTTPSN